jgi:hypothetical protein
MAGTPLDVRPNRVDQCAGALGRLCRAQPEVAGLLIGVMLSLPLGVVLLGR